MALLLNQEFLASEWIVKAGLVTFNSDGSIRMQNNGTNARIDYLDFAPVAIDPNAGGMVLMLHDQVNTVGRLRWLCRNFNDTGYTFASYPPAGGVSAFAESNQTVSSGGVRLRLVTDAANSDCTVERWSLFSENLLGSSGDSGVASYSPFRSQVFGS